MTYKNLSKNPVLDSALVQLGLVLGFDVTSGFGKEATWQQAGNPLLRALGKEARKNWQEQLDKLDQSHFSHVQADHSALEDRYRQDCQSVARQSNLDHDAWLKVRNEALSLLALQQHLDDAKLQLRQEQSNFLRNDLERMKLEMLALKKTLEERGPKIKDFFGRSDAGWDLDAGHWKRVHWKALDDAALFLASFDKLNDLARRIGRSRLTPPDDSSKPESQDASASLKQGNQIEELGRSEIVGYSQGRDLTLVPQAAWAHLFEPGTDLLFLKDYAESRLSNLDYLSQRQLVPLQNVQSKAPTPEQQGPAIICVDTSGSMEGLPEQAAKAMVLALVRICYQEQRPCFIISFSDRIETLDVSQALRDLDALSSFLDFSFRGGTDLRPALYRCLDLVREENWSRADVLIISDFKVPKILIKKSNLVKQLRDNYSTRLHAMIVSDGKVLDDLHIFDSHWHFRIDSKGKAAGIDPSSFKEVF